MSDNITINRNIKDEDAIYFLALLMKKYCPDGVAEFTEAYTQELPDHVTIMLVADDSGCIITYLEDGKK